MIGHGFLWRIEADKPWVLKVLAIGDISDDSVIIIIPVEKFNFTFPPRRAFSLTSTNLIFRKLSYVCTMQY